MRIIDRIVFSGNEKKIKETEELLKKAGLKIKDYKTKRKDLI